MHLVDDGLINLFCFPFTPQLVKLFDKELFFLGELVLRVGVDRVRSQRLFHRLRRWLVFIGV